MALKKDSVVLIRSVRKDTRFSHKVYLLHINLYFEASMSMVSDRYMVNAKLYVKLLKLNSNTFTERSTELRTYSSSIHAINNIKKI